MRALTTPARAWCWGPSAGDDSDDDDDGHDDDDDDDNGPQLRPPLHPRRGHGRGRDLGWQQQGLPALLQAAALRLAA